MMLTDAVGQGLGQGSADTGCRYSFVGKISRFRGESTNEGPESSGGSLTGLTIDARCVLGLSQELWTRAPPQTSCQQRPVQSNVWFFLGVMYRCESWTVKKAECRRTEVFKLCWRRLLRVLWTARRPNQSILKEIKPEYSLEGLLLKLQYFGHMI